MKPNHIIIVAVILVIAAYFLGRYMKKKQLIGNISDSVMLFTSAACSNETPGCVDGFRYIPVKEDPKNV